MKYESDRMRRTATIVMILSVVLAVVTWILFQKHIDRFLGYREDLTTVLPLVSLMFFMIIRYMIRIKRRIQKLNR